MIYRIILKIYKKIQKISFQVKSEIARKDFLRNCITGSNFKCNLNAKCFNEQKKKEYIKIGDNCEINGVLSTKENGIITIGSFTTIRHNTRLLAVNKIEIGDYVIISNNVTIYDNNNHPVEPEERIKLCKSGFNSELWHPKFSISKAIYIGDNVWIGERAIILKGVKIGKGSIVAMGAIVTKDIPEYTIVAGNPARVVRSLK